MPKHSDIVAKDNALIPSLAKLDLQPLRLLAFCLAHVDSKHDKEFKEVTAKVDELAELYGLKSHNIYNEIKRSVISINQKPAEYFEDGVSWVKFWFSSLGYKHKSGEFTFKLNDELAPYLLELKENFTVYRLKDIYQFTRATTWHLYECLRRWKVAKSWSVDFEELRYLLNLGDKYQRFYDFKKYVLLPGIDEINKVSDIKVVWKVKKSGRKISGLLFNISVNEANLTEREKAKMALSHLDAGEDFAPDLTTTLHEVCGINLTQARLLSNLIAQSDKVKHIKEIIPKLLDRWNRLKHKDTSCGGYCYKAIFDELSN